MSGRPPDRVDRKEAGTRARLRREVADLNPGYAAWVMASGIVSTGFYLFDDRVLSDVLLAVTGVAFVVLLVAYAWRVVRYRGRVAADARDPSSGFGYFSLVAAANVVGVRLGLGHHLLATLVLAIASVPVWLVLTYAIPAVMVVGQRQAPVLSGVNGSWFLWVVATQSLSVAAAALAGLFPGFGSAMAPLAVALWGLGVVLYLVLAGLVTLRLLDVGVTPHALSPTYWVYMGATAITVLAGAMILRLPAGLPVVVVTRQVVSGLAFLLWAFGTWWIPLLLIFGVWRHVIRRVPLRYDAALWSMVFPLGMYAVSSASYGRATDLGFMVDIARGAVWVGFAAWLGVLVAMAGSFLPGPRGATSPPAGTGTGQAEGST